MVSAAMQQRMGLASHLWLDATGLGRAVLERDFPTVTALCRARGIDPVTDPVPVAPGAHYACGGIRADMDGRTTVPGLYAVGEAASTGVHGANRLASNSLTEALIVGRRTGERLGQTQLGQALPGSGKDLRPPPAGLGADSAYRSALAAAGAGLDLATVEATNLHAVSVLVAASARARAESRGCHRWRDIPVAGPDRPGHHTVLRVEAGRPRDAHPVRYMRDEEVGA